ncbi:hypothetical protein ES708_15757 [subsurface metagenome]
MAAQCTEQRSEEILRNVCKAINLLMENQISDTIILSSYKISTVMKNYFGTEYKTELIGRKLAKLAKQNNLQRLTTRIPKYELHKSTFTPFPEQLA